MEGMKEVFSKGADRSRGDHEGESRDLHAKIGELTVLCVSRSSLYQLHTTLSSTFHYS